MKCASIMRIIMLALVPFSVGVGTDGRSIMKNGDFDRWTGSEPAGWETTNIPNTLTAVFSSTRTHGGKFAVRCEVKFLHSVGADIGFLSIAFMNTNGSSIGSVEEFLMKDTGEYVQFSRATRLPEGTARMDFHLTLLAGKGSTGVHEGSFVLLDDLECVLSTETDTKGQLPAGASP